MIGNVLHSVLLVPENDKDVSTPGVPEYLQTSDLVLHSVLLGGMKERWDAPCLL